jgi:hypothetical protein
VGFASDSEEPFQIQVTEAARTVGFEKSSGVPRAPKSGWIIKGLTLGEHGELRGAIFGDRPMPVIQLDEPPKKSEQQARSVERPSSPTVGKPHVRLISGGLGAANRVSPGQAMRIIGSGFKPGARVEIALDGRPVETEASVGPKGEFSATIAAPREFGLHRLTVRQGGNTDGIMFLVSHVDEHHGRIQKESASSRD